MNDFGKTQVNPEFNKQCQAAGVEVIISPFPNPGSPDQFLRQMKFRNLNIDESVEVHQQNERNQIHTVGPQAELTIAVPSSEKLPNVRKVTSDKISDPIHSNNSRVQETREPSQTVFHKRHLRSRG